MASENDMDSDDELDNDDIRDAYSRSALSAVHSENTRAPSQAVVHSLHTTGIEIVRRDWLQLPEMYTKPLRMCAVNQFVHCEINLDERYLSTGAEYVLVGKGSSMPKHFHMFAYCMEQLNRKQYINGCAVPVRDTTQLEQIAKVSGKSKQYDVIGIKRRVEQHGAVDTSVSCNWPQTTTKHKTFMSKCSERAADPEVTTYARVNLVELMWGLIPVEYMKDGVLYREVIHVLRAIPAPGFNLRLLLQKHFFDQRYSNKKNAAMIAEVCDLLEQVVNIEVDTNLKKTRMWGGALPNPWALTDPRSATSVERLLSPFILPKIFNNLPGGYSGMDKVSEGYDQSTLVISGFPDVRTPESAEAAIRFYEDREEKYLEAVKAQDIAFEQGLIKCSKDPEEEVELVPILSFNGVNYNCLEPDLCMVFYFKYWFALSKEGMYREVEKLTMPKLVVALMDLFQFSSLDCNLKECSRDNFIKAHVGENNEIVTETSIHEKYKVTDAQSLGDFPYDGNLRDRRMGFELNLDQIRNPDEVTPEMIQLYYEYLRLQLTTTWNGLELDAWMSDRVLRCAQCVRRLSPDLCDKTAAALQWATTGLTVEAARSMQSLAHDEVSFAWARMNAALCFLNKTGKANPINLSIIWAMLCSDVLTHLGMRNESWRWVMFPILVAPGMGHLRAQTEDGHSARSECMLLAKPNGAGVDEVVLKIFQWFLHLVGELLPLPPEFMKALQMLKVDRMTRPSLEEMNAVCRTDGKIYNQPLSTDFMKPLFADEFHRQLDEAALQGLVTTGLPRDSLAGEGATFKSQESKNRGPREKGCNQQLPGMGMYFLLLSTNTNSTNQRTAEALLTLIRGALSVYPPGAQQASGMEQLIEDNQKRKRGTEKGGAMSTGDPSLPTSPEDRKHLAYLFSVIPMICRHLGLLNKTGQSNWEISIPLREYIDDFKIRYFSTFGWSISQTLDQNNDRIMKGYISRAVAGCLVATVAAQEEQMQDSKEAWLQILLCTECSALTLYYANMGLLNGIYHLTDSGLLYVNQLIRLWGKSPVLGIDFLCSMLDKDKTVNYMCKDFQDLKQYLQALSDAYPQGGFTGSYALVPLVGSSLHYGIVEHYLQKFCGMNHGSLYSYMQAFKNASQKIIDPTDFLDLEDSAMDVRLLFRRCGVRYEDQWYNTPGDKKVSGNRYLILVPEPADRAGTTTVGRVFVHVVQHLFVSALLGNCDLHSNNPSEFAKNLFAFMVRWTVPRQAVPSCALMCETFQYRYGEVTEDLFPVLSDREYFVRKRKCCVAWRKGVLGQMANVLGAHPLEDVIHIHAWVQQHTMLCGSPPRHFYFMPSMVPRGAELVPGRIYPLLRGDNERGVICVCPEGLSFALVQMDEATTGSAVPLDRWQLHLQNHMLSVAPLIFRKHAVIQMEDKSLGVLQEQSELEQRCAELEGWKEEYNTAIHVTEKRNFLNCEGKYYVLFDDGTKYMEWEDVHKRLLPLGTHMVILKSHMPGSRSYPESTQNYVSGWLRYPDACDEGGDANDAIYVAFRVGERADDFKSLLVLPIPIEHCMTLQGSGVDADDISDYILP